MRLKPIYDLCPVALATLPGGNRQRTLSGLTYFTGKRQGMSAVGTNLPVSERGDHFAAKRTMDRLVLH